MGRGPTRIDHSSVGMAAGPLPLRGLTNMPREGVGQVGRPVLGGDAWRWGGQGSFRCAPRVRHVDPAAPGGRVGVGHTMRWIRAVVPTALCWQACVVHLAAIFSLALHPHACWGGKGWRHGFTTPALKLVGAACLHVVAAPYPPPVISGHGAYIILTLLQPAACSACRHRMRPVRQEGLLRLTAVRPKWPRCRNSTQP